MATATHKHALEREVKFSVEPGFALPRLSGDRLRAQVFTSTYYDTDDYRLARNGLTLRHRTKGRSGCWQLKLPMDDARLEAEFPGGSQDPPRSLTKLLCAHLGAEPLRPIARLRTRRKGIRVHGERGGLADVVVDVVVDVVSVMDGGKVIRRFGEAEAELVRGDPKSLRSIAKYLRKAGARKSDQRPKVFQALDLAYPPPDLPVSRSLPAVEQWKALIKQQLKQTLVHDVGVRLGTDPESVHQMRVAIRRLRALLRAARAMLATDWTSHLREDLAWLADALGGVRDLDVLIAHVREQRPAIPAAERGGMKRLLQVLAHRRTTRWHALVAVLESPRYPRVLQHLDVAANSPVVSHPDIDLAKIAAKQFKKLRRAVRKAGASPSDAELHRIRIKGKRARHAAELAAAMRGKPAARFIQRAKDLQDLLGEHQDAVMAEQLLHALLGSHADSTTAFVLGLLIERQSERRSAARAELPKVWARLKKCGRAVWRR